jgi:hypothetical protein
LDLKLLFAIAVCCLAFASSSLAAVSPWNGTWRLDHSRAEPDGAADDYRFTVTADGALRWEIPSLHEINVGRLDGSPMRINRPGAPAGETISVHAESPGVWTYKVELNGKDRGEGRMTLAADGKSWTDVPLDGGKPVERLLMVYVKA